MEQGIIIKQHISFLDKPLWFVNLRHDGKGFVWDDKNGFFYRSGYTPPDKIDALILYYLLYKSQKLGYQEKIVLTRYEIIKACEFQDSEYYYKRIEESLERWKNVTVKFEGTFYDNRRYEFFVFGIIVYGKIREDKLLEVLFDSSWLLKIKETNFFKYLNFQYIKNFKRSVSLRLYEILVKNFKGREVCHFKLTTLGKKLGLSGVKKKSQQGEETETIYASHVLLAIKPAINEINKLAKNESVIEKSGIFPEDLFTIAYEIEGKKQDRVIYLHKKIVPLKKSQKNHAIETSYSAELKFNHVLEENQVKTTSESNKNIQPAFAECAAWLEGIVGFHPDRKKEIYSMPIEQVVKVYPEIRKKYEAMAKKNKQPSPGWIYSAFTKSYQFTASVREAEQKQAAKKRQQELDERMAAEAKERKEQEELVAHQERFKSLVEQLNHDIKQQLWAEAQSRAPKNLPGNMHVPIEYAKLLLSHLREAGHDLLDKTVSSLEIVKQVMPRF